jgi:hypothetical protein
MKAKEPKEQNREINVFSFGVRENSSQIHNPISFEEFASKNAIIYLHFIFSCEKEISMEELHILWNCCQSLQLFKTHTRTPNQKRETHRRVEQKL